MEKCFLEKKIVKRIIAGKKNCQGKNVTIFFHQKKKLLGKKLSEKFFIEKNCQKIICQEKFCPLGGLENFLSEKNFFEKKLSEKNSLEKKLLQNIFYQEEKFCWKKNLLENKLQHIL